MVNAEECGQGRPYRLSMIATWKISHAGVQRWHDILDGNVRLLKSRDVPPADVMCHQCPYCNRA